MRETHDLPQGWSSFLMSVLNSSQKNSASLKTENQHLFVGTGVAGPIHIVNWTLIFVMCNAFFSTSQFINQPH